MTGRPMLSFHHFEVQDTPDGRLLAETRNGDVVHRSFLRGSMVAPAVPFPWLDRGVQTAETTFASTGAPRAKTERFRGRHVLLGLRLSGDLTHSEAWLAWHAALGFDAALIVDGLGGTPQAWQEAASGRAANRMAPTVVTASVPLVGLLQDGEPVLVEPIILEAVRHRFLAEAQSVTCLTLADLIIAPHDILARLETVEFGLIALDGQRAYPWRLRKGSAAPFSDHIYTRTTSPGELRSWIAAPRRLPENAQFALGALDSAPPPEAERGRFMRAMGLVQPGVDPKRLVDKAELSEDPDIAAALARSFDAAPLRRRKAVSPAAVLGDTITVVTTMKNEGPFILDWIAHHRAIGVDRFVVFTNDCEDGTDALLDAIAQSGFVERHDNPYLLTGKVPQRAAFDAARDLDAVTAAGWLITLDVDEYLNIHAGEGRLTDLFAACHEANVFSIPWRLFGSADVVAFEDRPVTRQFTRCAPAYCPRPHQAWGFKTIYSNAGLFRRLGVHRPLGLVPERIPDIGWVDGSGRPLPQAAWRKGWRMNAATWGYGLASVNHYAVRSAESYLVKRDRGRVNHTDRDQGTAYWFRMNQNAEENLSIRRYDPIVTRIRDELAGLPGVADLHDRAVAWHRDRIAALKRLPDYSALFDEITGLRLQRLSRMPGRFGSNVFLAGPEVIPDEVLERDPEEAWVWTVAAAERRD